MTDPPRRANAGTMLREDSGNAPVRLSALLNDISIRNKLRIFALGTSAVLTASFLILVWVWTERTVQQDAQEEVKTAMSHFNFVEETRIRQDLREGRKLAGTAHAVDVLRKVDSEAVCEWGKQQLHDSILDRKSRSSADPEVPFDLISVVGPTNRPLGVIVRDTSGRGLLCEHDHEENYFPAIVEEQPGSSTQISDWESPQKRVYELVQVPLSKPTSPGTIAGSLVIGFRVDKQFAQRILDEVAKTGVSGKPTATFSPMDIAIWHPEPAGTVHILGFSGQYLTEAKVQAELESRYSSKVLKDGEGWHQFQSNGYTYGNRPLGDQLPLFINAENLRVAVIQPLAPKLAPFHNLELVLALLAGLGMIFGFLLGAFLSKPIADPLTVLATLAETVSEGKLEDAHTMILGSNRLRARDEIGTLERSFVTMLQGLRERLAMCTFLSQATYDHICSAAVDGDSANAGVGVRTSLVVLFSDVRNFTGFAESSAPEAVIELLNQVLSIQAEIVERHGGDINKFIGDALFAWFAGEDRCKRALDASIEMIAALRERFAGDAGTQVGVGIHLGDLVVGPVGSLDRKDFTAIGSVVNMAARLCSAAEPGQVLVSSSVAAELNDPERLHPLPPIRLKGFTEPVTVFATSVKVTV